MLWKWTSSLSSTLTTASLNILVILSGVMFPPSGLVMTPRIEVPRTDLRVMTDSEQMTQPSVARKVIDLAKNRNSWTGTATELQLQIGDGKINQLFQPGIMEMLDRSGVTVTRWRTAKKRLINVSSANVTT